MPATFGLRPKRLVQIRPRAKTFKNYNAEEGLAGNAFQRFRVYFKNDRGKCSLVGSGITAFFPQGPRQPVRSADRADGLSLFNNLVPVGEKSVLRTSISYTDSMTLSHEQNIFSIEFSSLSYAAPQRNRYRYMLEGWRRPGMKLAATSDS